MNAPASAVIVRFSNNTGIWVPAVSPDTQEGPLHGGFAVGFAAEDIRRPVQEIGPT